MIVVGVGCGPDMLTQSAIRAIQNASKIFGSERAIAIAKGFVPDGCQVEVIRDFSKLSELPDDAVVLSTGDPMMAGLGHIGDEVIPGISSFQLAFSRLGLEMTKASIVNAHSKNRQAAITEAVEDAKRGKNVFMLTDPDFRIQALADALLSNGMECKLAICENLGYENESISVGTCQRPPHCSSKLYSVIVAKVTE